MFITRTVEVQRTVTSSQSLNLYMVDTNIYDCNANIWFKYVFIYPCYHDRRRSYLVILTHAACSCSLYFSTIRVNLKAICLVKIQLLLITCSQQMWRNRVNATMRHQSHCNMGAWCCYNSCLRKECSIYNWNWYFEQHTLHLTSVLEQK